MASPQESITTVNGRRCTRSRARTAATSILNTSEPPVVTPTEVVSSASPEELPPAQTSTAVQAPPPPSSVAAEAPPPPPPSSNVAEAPLPTSTAAQQPVAAPTTTQAAVSSATGTLSAAPLPSAPTTPLVNPAPSQQAAAGPKRPVELSRPAAAVVSQAAQATTAAPSVPAPASSDTISTAVLPPSPILSSALTPLVTAPGAAESAILPSSLPVDSNQSSQVDAPSEPTSTDLPLVTQPQLPTTPAPSLPSGDAAAGLIGPEPAGSDSEGGLTIPANGDANIGSIVGGVVGGVVGLALICALLFFCLRKRKSKQPRWAEKNVQGSNFLEKLKAIPAAVSVVLAKVKGIKKGPTKNPYQRHSQQDSISSIYSTTDSQGFYAAGDFMKRSSSRKSERNRLRKKNSSVSSHSTFTGIPENMEKNANNPFADPEPPRILRLSNPDSSPRGPLTPQPAMTSAHLAKDPFASPFDDPSILPPVQGHKRTQSQASALSSHPPSFIFPSRSNVGNKDPVGPPQVTRVPLPDQKRRSSMALPTFDATSTAASGESDYTLYGEPGPSRPATSMFTPGLPTGRTVRQSDPFDLDRPEVLGFGSILGRKEVRGSVTRQPTRSKRTSSAGNWVNVNDGPTFSWNVVPRR
jgi:hypothetical protein